MSTAQRQAVAPTPKTRRPDTTEEGYLVDCRFTRERGFEMKAHHYPGKRFRKMIQDISGNLWCATVDGITMLMSGFSDQSAGQSRWPLVILGVLGLVAGLLKLAE